MNAIDKKVGALLRDGAYFDPAKFVYPELVGSGRMFGEEIEEAIIEYLEARGFDRTRLQTNGEWVSYVESIRMVTTKCLTIDISHQE